MNYIDPLPIIKIKEERKKKLKQNNSKQNILIIKKLIKYPLNTTNYYHYKLNKYDNYYKKFLINSSLDRKNKIIRNNNKKTEFTKNKYLRWKKKIIKSNENNLIKEVKLKNSIKKIKIKKNNLSNNLILNKEIKENDWNNNSEDKKTIIINLCKNKIENKDKIIGKFTKKKRKSFTIQNLNNEENNFEIKNKENENIKLIKKKRNSLSINKEESLKELKNNINPGLLNKKVIDKKSFKETFYDLEILFKKNHQIINIINTNKNLYNNIIHSNHYNERLKIFNLKFFENEKLIFLNSMSFFVNNSQIMIPFSLSFFLMKYSDDYLVKFFKELIFLFYRRKMKGFKKSILNFHDFYLINKQIIHNTIDNNNNIKENYKIKEIPQNNKQTRKSIFYNNHNNNVVNENYETNLNLFTKFKTKAIESEKSSNSDSINSSNSESKSSSDSDSNNSSDSESSSFDEEELNELKKKNLPLKSENINKMEIIFTGNFNKSQKIYEAIIRFPLASIYLNGYINKVDKKIFRITNKEVNDLFSYEINNINHLIKRISNNNS